MVQPWMAYWLGTAMSMPLLPARMSASISSVEPYVWTLTATPVAAVKASRVAWS